MQTIYRHLEKRLCLFCILSTAGGSLSAGDIAAIVLACVLVVLAFGAGFYIYKTK